MGEAVSDTDVLTSAGQMFAAVLSRDEVDLDDDFLALGAHSISAGRLTGRIKREPGARILRGDFFADSTDPVLSARRVQYSP